MRPNLSKEVVSPGPRRLVLACAGGVAAAALAIVGIIAAQVPSVEPAAPAPAVHIDQVSIAIASPPQPIAEPEVRPVRQKLAFVFEVAGSSFMALAEAEPEALGAPHMITDGETGALAAATDVDVAALPAAIRAWQGRKVIVDGACEARVVGFTAIGRVLAQWSLIDDSGKPARGDALARAIFERGQVVIAAKLDGCTGTYARDAALPAMPVAPATARDGDTAARAVDHFRRLPEVKAAQRAWRKAGNRGHWLDDRYAMVEQRAFRHPTTGMPMVSVHALADVGCGGVGLNVWAVFRVRGDTFDRVSVKKLETIDSIDHILDVDGDGQLEWIVHDRGIDLVLLSASGTELLRLNQPFVGCRC